MASSHPLLPSTNYNPKLAVNLTGKCRLPSAKYIYKTVKLNLLFMPEPNDNCRQSPTDDD